MRLLHSTLVLAAFLTITALPGSVRAAGNVLLPTAPSTTTTEGSDDDSSSNDNSATDQSPSTPPEATPAVPAATPKPVPNSASLPTGQSKVSLPKMPPMPTKVTQIKQPSKEVMASWGKKLPHALSIGYAENAGIGPHDTSIIKSRLGIAEDKIKDVCSLVLNGTLQSNKGMYMAPLNMIAAHLIVKYDGTLSNVRLNIMTSCAKPASMPSNSGIVIQTGDKYMIPLSQVACTPPANQSVTQLAISYAGDGKGQCTYQ
jgi:hypothetical protein